MSEEEKILKEAKKLPWEDRLLHKNWKVRNDANIDLGALFESIRDPKDLRLKEFGPLFRKTLADSNSPVVEKALDALIAFLRVADADFGRFAKETCDIIVAKCLTGRPKIVEKSQLVFLLWVELEATEAFLDAMDKALKNKVAKAVVPAIDVMFQALSDFGTKVIPPKRIFKILPELFEHQDHNVRASSKGLTLELCRWVGKETVKSILFEKMRDTMKKELEAELVNVIGIARPSRKIRSEQDKEQEPDPVADVVTAHGSEEHADEVPSEIDEYELVDPVDILTPLGKSGFWDGVKATKWSERKDAVAELTRLASVKRVATGDFTEVCRVLKKLVTDVNLAVTVEAIQAIGNLAKGLRTHFSGSSRFLLPVLLDKLKEKKPTVVESLSQTLQTMHKAGCVNLADIVEDVKIAVKNKVPIVRSHTLNWVTFCIDTSTKTVVLKAHKDYVPICMECLNDGTVDVRDAAFSALAAIAKLVGLRSLERSLEKLDDVRKKKLSELIGATGSSLPTTVSSGPCGGKAVSEMPDDMLARKSAASMLTKKKPTYIIGKKGTSVKSACGNKTDGVRPARISKAVDPDDIEPTEMSLEEVENRLSSLFQVDTLLQLKSGVWKERLEAVVSVKEKVQGLQDLKHSAEFIIRLLCIVPGWNEKNLQIQQQVIEIISHITMNVDKFSKKCVVLCILGIGERVADIKTRAHSMKCLSAFAEAVGPGFVFERMYKIMKEHKNPKVLSEGIIWMVSAVEDFSMSHLNLKDLIDFCKDTGLQSSVAACRNATIKLVGILHRFVGPDVKGFLTEVKPALLSALEAEYEKNPFVGSSVAPKRTVKGSVSSLSSTCGNGGLPYEDISGKLTATLIKGLECSDWKVRLESIEAVNMIIVEANKRVQPTGTGELFGSLRSRLHDSNKNLIMATLSTLGALASAMGPAIDKAGKGILSDILKCLGDNKKSMRESVLAALDSWNVAVHLDKMIPYITTGLTDPKIGAEGRKDLFVWLSRILSEVNDSFEVVHLLKPTGCAMMDKSSDVRKSAESCLSEIFRICGQEAISECLNVFRGPILILITEKSKAFANVPGIGKPAKSVQSGVVDHGSKHGNRARPITVKGSRQESVLLDSIQGHPLINIKDSCKADREKMIIRKFKFEEPRPEQIQDLEADVGKYFREDLHRLLVTNDFKKQIEAIELLQKQLPSAVNEIVEVIDIILKWSVLRICESNTTCLLKVMEFLSLLFVTLRGRCYIFTESEASIFIPCLVEKSGHNIERVREKMRELVKHVVAVYSVSKIFPFVMDGLRSKNNRTRVECVEFAGYLIEHHGNEIGGHMKSLQLVACLTAERDSEIRKASLNTLATGYKIIGDDIWKYVGKLTDAQKSMLDDKFKWKAKDMERRKEGKPGETRATLRRSVRDNGSEVAQQSGDVSRSTPSTLFSRLHFGARSPTDWNEALDIISTGSSEQSVEAMKVVCHELAQVTLDPDGSAMDDIVKDADKLVFCLASKVAKTFDFSLEGASSRSCKYVLNTLMQTLQSKKLAHAVKVSTLGNLISELLLWLLDERVPRMDDGSQLLKALNVLMLKILDNADRTSSFVVLINLLRPLDPSRWPSSLSNDNLALRNQKFYELVIKCLIKLTKLLQSTIYDVDLDLILESIHIYLQELGMDEIRKRAGADDKPLRMVKTVLHELVKLRGTTIKGHLSLVPIDMEPQPIILAYIDLNLQTIAAARMLSPSGTTGQMQWGDSTPNNSASAAHSVDVQFKQELAEIFKKIGAKQTCTVGLYELYRITQLYPKVDIFSQLQNASEAFRTYIRDGLAQMERNALSGRSPSSLPLSTPPPSTLTPPQHIPSYNDIKSVADRDQPVQTFSIPPSRDDAKSGTLEAIRERMRNIQLTSDSQSRHLSSQSEIYTQMSTLADSGYGGGECAEIIQTGGGMVMDGKALSDLQARMERLKSGAGVEYE